MIVQRTVKKFARGARELQFDQLGGGSPHSHIKKSHSTGDSRGGLFLPSTMCEHFVIYAHSDQISLQLCSPESGIHRNNDSKELINV